MLKNLFACYKRRKRPFLFILLILTTTVSFAQQKRLISGVVATESNYPLQDVSVLIKGQKTGTTTDAKGQFSLEVPENGVLVFSIIGYEDKQLNPGKTNTLNVSLVSRTASLGDVVVIGYGTSKRKDLTGAISSVNLSKTGEIPMVSVDQVLSGRASNVQINQSSGQAGAGSNIRIRGGNSLIGTNQPLFVIDGFPIISDNDAFSSGNVIGLTNGASGNPNQQNANGALNWLNPSDIQSIEILKDASSTAIYGSRGGNGVIIVTTKKGRRGVPKMNLDVSLGISQLNKSKIKLMNGSQYAQYNNLVNIHNGNAPIYVDTTINGKNFPVPSAIGEGTNWVDQVTGNGAYNKYSLTFSGGTETLFSGSIDYLKQGTPLLNSQFNRLNARLDAQSDLTSWLTLDNNIIFSSSTINNSPSDVRDVQKFGMWVQAPEHL